MANVQNKLDAIQVMMERHTVRHYEKGHEIPQETLEAILRAASLAPSSWNLQHWKFLVIQSPEQKEKLLPIAYGQQQVVDSSVVVAVLGDVEANKNAELVWGRAVEQGKVPEQVKETMVSQINGAYQNQQFARDEAVLNASLAAMQLMLAAKAHGYDTCPMGGFDRARFAEAFRVPARYIPVMLITVGKAAKPAHPSDRLSLDEIVVKETF